MWVRSKDKKIIGDFDAFEIEVYKNRHDEEVFTKLTGTKYNNSVMLARYETEKEGMRTLESIVIRQNRINAGDKLTDIYEIV